MLTQNEGCTQPLCKTCHGSGKRVIHSVSGLPAELGVFCPDCELGRQKWKAVLTLIGQCEPDRLTSVFVPRRRPPGIDRGG